WNLSSCLSTFVITLDAPVKASNLNSWFVGVYAVNASHDGSDFVSVTAGGGFKVDIVVEIDFRIALIGNESINVVRVNRVSIRAAHLPPSILNPRTLLGFKGCDDRQCRIRFDGFSSH